MLLGGIHRQSVAPLYDGLVSTSQMGYRGLGARSLGSFSGDDVLVVVAPVVVAVAAAAAAASPTLKSPSRSSG